MNQIWEEHRIRELMVEMRERDEADAPDFASVWNAAAARANFERRHRYFIRVAAIAASVALLGSVVGGVLLRERDQTTHVSSAPPSADLPWQSAVLICEWRSPTDFLLRLPGEQLLEPFGFPANALNPKQ